MHTSASKTTIGNGPHRAGDDVNKRYDELKTDVSRLANSVKRLASEELAPMVSDVQTKATQQMNKFESTVRRNPTQAAMIAAGAGFLLGLVMIR